MKISKSNKNITVLLMEQKVVSGVGNYLKSESLYSARINPWARINNLTDDNLLVLYGAIRDNIGKSYRAGGASIRHYSDINDVSGVFEYDMNVYNKKKCSDGTEIKHEETPDKRATYWCPSIQINGVS
jgi:formamidopyrimidine-DNA glycosylase